MKRLLTIVAIVAAPTAQATDFHFDFPQEQQPAALQSQAIQQALHTAATRHCQRLYRRELSLQGVRRCQETIVRHVLKKIDDGNMTAQVEQPGSHDKG